jgi:hypothetical protein
MATKRDMNTHQDPSVLPATPSTSSHGNIGRNHGNHPTHATTRTSTPVTGYHGNTNATQGDFVNVSPLRAGSDRSTVEDSESISVMSMSMSTESEHEVLVPGHISVPILGYEVMEEHARFSVSDLPSGENSCLCSVLLHKSNITI